MSNKLNVICNYKQFLPGKIKKECLALKSFHSNGPNGFLICTKNLKTRNMSLQETLSSSQQKKMMKDAQLSKKIEEKAEIKKKADKITILL
jgi:hypothetical protein